MKAKIINYIELILVIVIFLICLISALPNSNNIIFLNNINYLINKIGIIICVLIPFLIITILELIKISKEIKRREYEYQMNKELLKLNDISTDKKITSKIEETIKKELEEIKEAKGDFKKIDSLEQTIQIPLSEIQEQIEKLTNKKNKKSTKELTDDTVVLFDSKEIQKEIEKDKKSTKNVDK